MRKLTTITDCNGNKYAVSRKVLDEINQNITPLEDKSVELYKKLEKIVRGSIIAKLRSRKDYDAEEVTKVIWGLWSEFVRLSPTSSKGSAIYYLFHPNVDLSFFSNFSKISKELEEKLFGIWNSFSINVNPMTYPEINGLLEKAEPLYYEYENVIKTIIPLLIATRKEIQGNDELKTHQIELLSTQKELAKAVMSNTEQMNTHFQNFFDEMKKIREELEQVASCIDSNPTEARSKLFKLAENFNLTLFSFGNVEFSQSAVKNELTVFKNGV